jgi:cytochrome P450
VAVSTSSAPVDFPTHEVARCPYPTYATLRSEHRVQKVPGRNEYLISRHADIVHVIRHPELFSNVTYVLEDDGMTRAATLADFETRSAETVSTFQSSDPPAHKWKRKLASEHFRPGRVRTYEPIIRATVDRLIDGFIDTGKVEFISEFARPVGARATMLIVGLPEEDSRHAVSWSRYEGQGTRYHDEERRASIAEDVHQMHVYIESAIRERYERPRDDVLTAFVQSHVERNGEELGLQHARYDTFSVMLGAAGTSSHMLGNIMLLLLQNPDQMAKARSDSALLANAIEETLRLESPVQWNVRLVRADTEIDGVPVPAGALVLLLFGAANRDADRFEDPDRFDVERDNSKLHLAFGNGLHFCLGAPLARLEAQIAFERLFARLESIRLARSESYERLESLAFRGLESLELEFTPA